MKIAVASGKGGTGKTTVATGLGVALRHRTRLVVDCDVEAPNAHLFFKQHDSRQQEVYNRIPQVDPDRCTYCGLCADTCKFNAITVLNQNPSKPVWMLIPNLCHACGACELVCPTDALSERLEQIGTLASAQVSDDLSLAQGTLTIGKASGTPVIRELKKWVAGFSFQPEVIIYDAPPGASCSVVETIKDADFVLLVTEPTPFGLHDLNIAAQLTRELDLPAGIIINRDGIGDHQVDQMSKETGIPILMRIPMRREIAEAISNGIPLPTAFPEYEEEFIRLFQQIEARLNQKPRRQS
ncbi:MAG: ATP-binding protein [Anaerolineaceae bacterium]|nr:ATP-binding protein [Anaerolineaceae bacterium]